MKSLALALAFTASAATAHASSQFDSAPFDYVVTTPTTPSISENQAKTAAAIVVVVGLCLLTDLCDSGPSDEEEPTSCRETPRQGDCIFLDQAERLKLWEVQ